MPAIVFHKYHGTGNDFILVDNRERRLDADHPAAVAALCHRRFGIGADGLMLLEASTEADFRMRYYNADGRPGSMCGNGGRCIAAFARALGVAAGEQTRFEAYGGIYQARFLAGGRIALQMQAVGAIERPAPEVAVLNTGSPHYVWRIQQGWDSLDLSTLGRQIRNRKEFEPDGINVNVFQEAGPAKSHLRMRTYERGVEAETFSCGTGAVAVAAAWRALFATRTVNEVRLDTPGGQLSVRFGQEAPELIGPAVAVFSGRLDMDAFGAAFPGESLEQ